MKRLLLFVFLLLLPCFALAEEFTLTATVAAEQSALLALPVENAEAVVPLAQGDGLTITALGSTYCQASSGENRGYVALGDITFDILHGEPMVLGEVDVSPTNIMFGRITLRAEASTKSTSLCRMEKGRLVLILGEKNGMVHLAMPGHIGYAIKKFVRSEVEMLPYTIAYVDNDEPVHLRLDSRYGENWIITKLEPGTPVQLFRNPNGWAQVEVAGQRGRIVGDFLSDEAP